MARDLAEETGKLDIGTQTDLGLLNMRVYSLQVKEVAVQCGGPDVDDEEQEQQDREQEELPHDDDAHDDEAHHLDSDRGNAEGGGLGEVLVPDQAVSSGKWADSEEVDAISQSSGESGEISISTHDSELAMQTFAIPTAVGCCSHQRLLSQPCFDCYRKPHSKGTSDKGKGGKASKGKGGDKGKEFGTEKGKSKEKGKGKTFSGKGKGDKDKSKGKAKEKGNDKNFSGEEDWMKARLACV